MTSYANHQYNMADGSVSEFVIWRTVLISRVKLISTILNTYAMKQPDLYYFETIKMTSLYGEYEPQAGILCELWLGLWRHLNGFKTV